MRIIYNPQMASFSVSYTFDGEKVTARMDKKTDTFDFSDLPDGETDEFTTTLPACPVFSAKRVNGELTVTIFHWYADDAEPWEQETREEVV